MKAEFHMVILTRLVAVIILLGATAQQIHAQISDEEYAFFLKESYGKYWDPGEPVDIDDQFYQIAARTDDPDAAIAEFAAARGLSESDALDYAQAIIRAVHMQENCGYGGDRTLCRFDRSVPQYNDLRRLGMRDATGEIAVVIAKALPDGPQKIPAARLFYETIESHPNRNRIIRTLLEYGRGELWLSGLMVSQGVTVEDAAVIFNIVGKTGTIFLEPEDLVALADGFYRSVGDADDVVLRLMAAQSLMALQFQAGLDAEAMALYRGLSDDARAEFFNLAGRIKNLPRRRFYRALIVKNLGNQIAAGLIALGDISAAQEMLAQLENLQIQRSRKGEVSPITRALKDAIEQTVDPESLYSLYVYGLADTAGLTAKRLNRSGGGWVFSINTKTVGVRRVVAKRLASAGLTGLRNYLVDTPNYPIDSWELLPGFKDILPEDFAAQREIWRNRIETANSKTDNTAQNASLVTPAQPQRLFRELPLPVDLQAADCAARDDGFRNLPEDVDFPVSPDQIIRFETNADGIVIIYQATEINRSGEIPAYGYWFRQKPADGSVWQEPLYLGFQQFFPYQVRALSKLPMLAEPGKLTLEVDIREIDPASITFPPIGLGLKREACNFYLSYDLADLARDSDGDGMTDSVEAVLGLDPQNADSDGDLIPDGVDSLPLTTFDPFSPAIDKELALAILTEVVGLERNAIMVGPDVDSGQDIAAALLKRPQDFAVDYDTLFVTSDPKIFAGIRLNRRLMIYDRGDLDKLGRGDAPFYPVGIKAIFSKPDQSERYVIWDAVWTGGRFVVRCKDGICETTVLEQWIT
jgi:hypothetical protein